MARRIIAAWCSKYPYRCAEIESEGLYALTYTANNIKHDNPIAQVKKAIEGMIRNAVKGNKVVHVPRSFQDKNKDYGQTTVEHTVALALFGTSDASQEVVEFYEFCLSKMHLTALEKQIIKYRRQEISDDDIAKMLGYTTRHIRAIRVDLHARFNTFRFNKKIRARFFGES